METKINSFGRLVLLIIAVACLTMSVQLYAQDPGLLPLRQENVAQKEGRWSYFNKGYKVPVDSLIRINSQFFDLPEDIDSQVESKDIDEFGNVHYMIRLTIYNIPIDDAYFTIHYDKDGNLLHIVGNYNKNIIPLDKPTAEITSENALENAKKEFLKYHNLSTSEDNILLDNEITEGYRNKKIIPQLVYYHRDHKTLKLCYRVDISSAILGTTKTIYIDAFDGVFINIVEYRTRDVATTATVYNGSRSIQVKWRGWPNNYYYLRDISKSSPIETRNSEIHYGYPTCQPWFDISHLDPVYKGDLNWPINFKENAASSHWAAQKSYEVFRDTFGRTYGTFSSSGGEINIINNYKQAPPFYDGSSSDDYIRVGSTLGTLNGFEGSLDIIGHEFTHGVMYRQRGIAGNSYDSLETGALCESFADIFAEVIEYYTLGQNDWVVGTNMRASARRSLANPKAYLSYYFAVSLDNACKYFIVDSAAFENPVIYGDSCWIPGPGSLPSHINNSVQNYWFYLLANGGINNGITVSGIGIQNAARIAYRNMVYYLILGSTFNDMRQASETNAITLFGECSDEFQQVRNAWAAVGVGAAATACLSAYISGPYDLMYGEEGHWEANVSGGSGNYSYSWYVDNQNYSNSSSIDYSFYPVVATNYPIALSVTDGSLSDYDETSVHVYPDGMMQSYNPEIVTMSLSPNPSDEYTSLRIDIKGTILDSSKENDEITILIVDASGRILLNTNIRDRLFEINTSVMSNGTYTVVASTNKWKSSTNLIVNH